MTKNLGSGQMEKGMTHTGYGWTKVHGDLCRWKNRDALFGDEWRRGRHVLQPLDKNGMVSKDWLDLPGQWRGWESGEAGILISKDQ
jgi:hypothetical protein